MTETRKRVYNLVRITPPRGSSQEVEINLELETMEKREAAPKKASVPFLAQFQKLRRDRIQDRLLHASELNCDRFLKNLKLFRSDTDFLGSFLEVSLGAAGSIFGNASTVLSGIQTAVTGANEALDDDFFNNLSAEVINRAIRARRTARRLEMVKKREEGINQYTLLAAILDAQQYHNACSLDEGFKELDKSLSDRVKELESELKAVREKEKAAQAEEG